MSRRYDYRREAPKLYAALGQVQQHVNQSSLEASLLELVKLRASQINGCAYCIDMHTKDALAAGEEARRLFLLDAWRETELYSARERAALAWTESLTRVADHGAPDALYEQVRGAFSEREIAELTFAIVTINAWNRLSIAAHNPPDYTR